MEQGYGSTQANEPKQDPRIRMELARQAELLDRLSKAVAELSGRLCDVMRPQPAIAEAPNQRTKPSCSQLANTLNLANDQIEICLSALVNILLRVEL
jgi:hypothetical protein